MSCGAVRCGKGREDVMVGLRSWRSCEDDIEWLRRRAMLRMLLLQEAKRSGLVWNDTCEKRSPEESIR
jgi:hypothetical protein